MLWGHSPHYVNTSPNSKVTHALLDRLRTLVDHEVDLEELRSAGESFEAEVTKAMGKQAELGAYVRRLEKRYDAAYTQTQTDEIPSSEDMVQELEDFLKSQRRQNGEQGEG